MRRRAGCFLATCAACSDARGARGGRCGAAVCDGAVAAHDVVDGHVLVVRVEQVVGVGCRSRQRVRSAELRWPALNELVPRARRVEQRALAGVPVAVGAADALAGRRAARRGRADALAVEAERARTQDAAAVGHFEQRDGRRRAVALVALHNVLASAARLAPQRAAVRVRDAVAAANGPALAGALSGRTALLAAADGHLAAAALPLERAARVVGARLVAASICTARAHSDELKSSDLT